MLLLVLASLLIFFFVIVVGDAQEAAPHTNASIASCNYPRRIDACGGSFDRARNIEHADDTVAGAQKAMQHTEVPRMGARSRNRSRRVDACGGRECAPTRCSEARKGAVGSTQEATHAKTRTLVLPRNRPCGVDACGEGEDRAQGIEGGES